MPTSGQYSELLYAHLLDADGSRLTYTHYTSRVPYRSLLEITFNRPFYIQRNKVRAGIIIFTYSIRSFFFSLPGSINPSH